MWVAHGEGKFTFVDDKVQRDVNTNCVALRYTDDDGAATMR